MEISILVFGFIFGAILQYANLNKLDSISGLATRDNFTVLKALAVAIGIGAIILSVEIWTGFASYHIKPFIIGGIVLGGLTFGTGMAILGYCPGTLPVSLGQGSVDALIGIFGGLLGGFVYTIGFPSIQEILGPNLGAVSLNSLMGTTITFSLAVITIAATFITASFWLHKYERSKDKNFKWLYAGIGLALLNAIIILTIVSDRPVGASTSYPYFADILTGTINNDYFHRVEKPGHWELIFLLGAFLAGLTFSIIKKEFKIVLIHENWKKYKGPSPGKRIFWSFVSGFILIFGARLAGGCTSGHILSGGMQLAVSSLVFAVFVFTAFLFTGHVFYKMNWQKDANQ